MIVFIENPKETTKKAIVNMKFFMHFAEFFSQITHDKKRTAHL